MNEHLVAKALLSRLGLREKDTQDARLLLSVSPGCFASTSEDFAVSVVVEYVFVGEVESSNSLMLSNLL